MRALLLTTLLLAALSITCWAQEEMNNGHEHADGTEEYAMPPAGSISFLMIGALDVDVAAEFYSSMFGWVIEPGDGSEESEGMAFWSDPHGAMGGFDTIEEPVNCNAYVFYITVDDITAKLGEIAETGGAVFVEEMELPGDWGNIGMFTDPSGNIVGLWSP
jgi:predicted enzyme related to lactoylglutathione lyase